MSAGADSGRPLAALTGATGFLGSHIADRLLARGWRVRASVRPTSSLRWVEGKDIELVRVEILRGTDPGGASPMDFLHGADAVVHCAGVVAAPSRDAYVRGNVETTRTLLAAATASSCRAFVLVSSLAAGGPAPRENPRTEATPDRPLSDYGRSKLAAEELIRAPGLPIRTAALRPPALYGPRDRAFLPLFRLALAGWTVRLGGALGGLSLVDGRDAAAAAVALLETDAARGVYHVDDGAAYTFADMAAALGNARGRPVRTLRVPIWPLKLAARLVGDRRARRSAYLNPRRLSDLSAPGWVCSGERLRRETGFSAQFDLERGFTDTLAFYRREGWLD